MFCSFYFTKHSFSLCLSLTSQSLFSVLQSFVYFITICTLMGYKPPRQISSIVSLWDSIYMRQIWSLLKITKLYTFLSPFIYIYIPMFIGINVFPFVPPKIPYCPS